MIEQALQVFNLPYEVESITDFPDFTLYELRASGAGATLNRLSTRMNDIKSYTKSDVSIVIDKGIFLRVEKESKNTFLFTDYDAYLDRHPNMELPFMVGLTANECIVEDLAKAPHMLVAGTTGSGKSNYLHTFITSLLTGQTPVCMHLIDCKRVEFNVYKGNAHIYNTLEQASSALRDICYWMDKRYEAMAKEGYDNFKDYRKAHPEEYYHVVVIDELSDLIGTKEAKNAIVPRLLRIAQLGRAGGFHLILATQRPDHTVINGTLKGNIPTRIAFNCASRWDSQVILDYNGAENLTGNGDGLFLKNGSRSLTRFQALYIDKNYIKNLPTR